MLASDHVVSMPTGRSTLARAGAAAACLFSMSSFARLAAQTPAAPTFTSDIAPIVYAQCVSCHRPDGVGPFSLLSYQDVKAHAAQIADVTRRRVMPPWKAVGMNGVFLDERVLSDAEIQTIRAWVDARTPEGDPADLAPPPDAHGGWQLGTPDLVVTLAQPYELEPSGTDVFRTFVVPIPLTEPHWVKAVEFQPGNPRAIHHASFGIDRTRSSRRLDLLDPEPGYVGGMVEDARYPEGQLLGWTPGRAAQPSPPDMAWRLEAGSDLVMQLHMPPTGRVERVQPSVGFYFIDQAPTRTPVGLRLGSETIDIPAGDPDYTISDTYVLPVDVELIAVQPHAHYLGHQMNAIAILPDGSRQALITIDDWDFRWQDVYRYRMPVALPAGTTIAMRYTYDNSDANVRNPSHPPRRVEWGQNTTDEMGDLWLQMVPTHADDVSYLTRDIQRKGRLADLAAYTRLMEEDPANPLRHDMVGMLHLQGGEYEEAVAQFQESLRLNPNSAPTHYNLGVALSALHRGQDAAVEFAETVRLDPNHADAHNNLGALLNAFGRLDDARTEYERAIALRPDNVEAHNNLGRLLLLQGETPAAIAQFRRALELRPDWPDGLTSLAWAIATTADPALMNSGEAVALAERAAGLTRRTNALTMDALAAAYAAAGRFDEAVLVAGEAVNLAASAGSARLVLDIQARREMYAGRTPFHLTP